MINLTNFVITINIILMITITNIFITINTIITIIAAIILANMGAKEKENFCKITKFSSKHDIELFGEEMMTRKRFLTRGRKGQAVEAMGVKCLSICLGAQFTTRSG